MRVQPAQLDQLLHPQFDPKATYDGARQGPQRVAGRRGRQGVLHRRRRRGARTRRASSVILVRPETSPDDLHGMIAAEGILTSRGGLVSHAAVVARGMGKPAICGADALKIDLRGEAVRGRRHRRARRRRDLDLGHDRRDRASARSPVITPEPTGHFGTILGWADELRTLKVRTNADLPEDAARRASSAPKASACAAPSTCSSVTGCRSCSA